MVGPAVVEREPVFVADAEIPGIRELEAQLTAMPTAALVGPDGTPLPLPEPVYRLLARMVRELARGNAVTITPVHADLTTQQAADLLNISRPFLVKLLEAGEIPSHRVGAHRRVRSRDVLAYRHRRHQERHQALAELLREAQGAGLYDEEYPGVEQGDE